MSPTDFLVQPGKQTVSYIKSQVYTESEEKVIIQPSPDLEGSDGLNLYPALTTTQNRQFTVLIKNFLEQLPTLKKGYQIETPQY